MTGLVRDLILSAGKIIIFVGALATFLLTMGYLFFPELLKAISKPVNQLFSVEEWMYGNKQMVGIVFLVITVLLFLVLIVVK
jgi:hypothetical protein